MATFKIVSQYYFNKNKITSLRYWYFGQILKEQTNTLVQRPFLLYYWFIW